MPRCFANQHPGCLSSAVTSVELWWGYEQDSVRIPCSVFTSVELSCPECSVQEPCDVFRKLSHLHVLFPAPFLPDGRLLNPAHSKLAPPWSFVMSSDSPLPQPRSTSLTSSPGHRDTRQPSQARRSGTTGESRGPFFLVQAPGFQTGSREPPLSTPGLARRVTVFPVEPTGW